MSSKTPLMESLHVQSFIAARMIVFPGWLIASCGHDFALSLSVVLGYSSSSIHFACTAPNFVPFSDAVCLSALAEPSVCSTDGRLVLVACLAISSQGQAGRTDHAGDCRSHAFDHASKLAGLFAMNLRGPMPQFAPETYSPSIVEWGISIGLIAAIIFLFGLGARLLPLLPKAPTGSGE